MIEFVPTDRELEERYQVEERGIQFIKNFIKICKIQEKYETETGPHWDRLRSIRQGQIMAAQFILDNLTNLKGDD